MRAEVELDCPSYYAGENLIGTQACLGGPIGFDSSGHLWAAEGEDDDVIDEFSAPFSSGMNASLVFVSGDAANSTSQSYFFDKNASIPVYATRDNFSVGGLAFDSSGNLWISDDKADQVLEFNPPFNPTPSLTSTTVTNTFTYCPPANLCGGAQQVTTYSTNTATFTSLRSQTLHTASKVVGKDSSSEEQDCAFRAATADSFCYPTYLAFDLSGNMWVADEGFQRVLGFRSGATTPFVVIGEKNFTTEVPEVGCVTELPTPSSVCGPGQISFDSSGNLWVADGGAPRVLRFGGMNPCLNNVSAVPYMSQVDPAWGSKRIGNSTNPVETIAAKGCAITSAAMMLSYISNKTVTPSDLNDWLTKNNGYDKVITTLQNGTIVNHGNYDLLWPKIAEYSTKVLQIPLYWGGSIPIRNDTLLDQYLSYNFPVLISEPGHWILATCQNVTIGGIDNFQGAQLHNYTYSIRDPGHRAALDLNSTFLLNSGATYSYKNTYQAIRLFSTIKPAAGGSLTVSVHSPVELSITDPLQRVTSVTSSQIPNSAYTADSISYDNDVPPIDPPVPAIDIVGPMNGTYTLRVIGTGSGNYSLDFLVYDNDGNSYSLNINGSTTVGEVHVYQFSYSNAPNSHVHPVLVTGSSDWLSTYLPLVVAVVASVTAATVAFFYFGRVRSKNTVKNAI